MDKIVQPNPDPNPNLDPNPDPNPTKIDAEINTSHQNTLNQTGNQTSQSPIRACARNRTSDRLKVKVPKPFKYPERYTSPTDQIVSPVTRGILARNRKSSMRLPPSANQTKIQALKLQELEPLPN